MGKDNGYPKYFVTQPLTADQMRSAMLALPSFLREEIPSGTLLTASYGWGCQLHPDLCYRDMQVGIGWLDRFISDSLKSIVVPGDSDFTINAPNDRFVVHFCHEGDIHTGGSDKALQKRLWIRAPFDDFPLYWREGVRLLAE